MAKKMFILMILFIVLVPAFSSATTNPDSTFARANKDYGDKLYPEALKEYLSLEQNGIVSAPLYYNIGNCYYELGELGYAILYYLRAQRLSPDDEDINNNLAFARQFMAVTLEGVRINPVTDFMDSLAKRFTLNSLAWISSGLFIFFMLFLAVVLYLRYSGLTIRILGYALATVLICSAILTTYKYRTDYMTPKGVIVASEAKIYSGPDENQELEFTGSYGLVFQVEREENNYYLVMFENKRKGWINKDLVALI